MKQLSYNTGIKTRRPNITSTLYPITQKKIKPDKPVNNEDELFENLQLKKPIADL